jgi:hypothetical protein
MRRGVQFLVVDEHRHKWYELDNDRAAKNGRRIRMLYPRAISPTRERNEQIIGQIAHRHGSQNEIAEREEPI